MTNKYEYKIIAYSRYKDITIINYQKNLVNIYKFIETLQSDYDWEFGVIDIKNSS
jgi:hypothetical protein